MKQFYLFIIILFFNFTIKPAADAVEDDGEKSIIVWNCAKLNNDTGLVLTYFWANRDVLTKASDFVKPEVCKTQFYNMLIENKNLIYLKVSFVEMPNLTKTVNLDSKDHMLLSVLSKQIDEIRSRIKVIKQEEEIFKLFNTMLLPIAVETKIKY